MQGILGDAFKLGENNVFDMMKYILEREYSGLDLENAKYFCKKVAEVYEDDLTDELREFFLGE